MSRFIDAHNHLQDARFGSRRDEAISECARIGLVGSVVNGTSPLDWGAVTELADRYTWIVPSYGVHPWYIDRLQKGWLDELRGLLGTRPSAVGEIGIDHWKEGLDRDQQEHVFVSQLKLATELNRPASIHGLKAWPRLLELLREHGTPKAGFLLHSYSGPVDLVGPFAELGAYFSCAPAFLSPPRAKKLEVFKAVPIERLLPETDAPDQGLPSQLDTFHFTGGDGAPLNHPASIAVVYRGLAELLGMVELEIARTFEENFTRLFRP